LELFKETKEFLAQYRKYIEIEEGKWYQLMYDGFPAPYPAFSDIDKTLWLHPTEFYFLGGQIEYQEIFNREIKALNDKGIYFLYCKFKIYEKTYEERLNKFLETYEDAFPVHFLEDELKIFIKPIFENAIYERLESKYKVDFSFTIDRCISYLIEEQARKIGYAITIERDGFNDIVSYKIEDAKKEKESILSDTVKQPLSEKEKWFPIGLGFAKGEIQNDLKKNISARKIANKYTKESDANYITGTGITQQKDPKNIYSDLKKMKIVFVHCIENDIIVCDEFKKAYDIKLRELN
jgi:hypothetical protein